MSNPKPQEKFKITEREKYLIQVMAAVMARFHGKRVSLPEGQYRKMFAEYLNDLTDVVDEER